MRIRNIITAPLVAGCVIIGCAITASASPGEYEVQRGDTLSQIAERYKIKWPKLFELNQRIIDDPDLIFPGQVLQLDRPSVETSQQESSPGKSASSTLPATGSITSGYGMRTHPITGVHKMHTGTDFSIGDGNAYAARAGTVDAVTYDGAWGNRVIVRHGNGVKTWYCHLSSPTVSVGESVSAGDVMGRIGATGLATGPHLHFEVRVNGEHRNPLAWLN